MVSMSKNENPNFISVKVGDDLYQLILEKARSDGVHLIDVVVHAVAAQLGRPDLGYVPRGQRGPKPGKRRRRKAIAV